MNHFSIWILFWSLTVIQVQARNVQSVQPQPWHFLIYHLNYKWEILNFSTSQMWRNLKFLYLWHVCDVENVVSWFTLFCRKICFVAIHALLCGENLSKNCICGEKWQIWGMGSYWPEFETTTDWTSWVGSKDAWLAWNRWLIYTATRLRTTFWLFMDKMNTLHWKEACKR